ASARSPKGTEVWAADVSTVVSGKSRLDATTISSGTILAVWQDERNGGGNDDDLYGQNLRSDGTLGVEAIVGDLNDDGVVNGADLTILLGSWGACPPKGSCIADLNGDGVVNGADLTIQLGNWG
ncbi:MAG: Dockerin type domain, partial [Planctomycetota bacterium]